MNQTDFIVRLVRELERAQVPYMFVGSHASSFHGYPRTSVEELARRVREIVETVEANVASVEDTIISKLEWAKAGESERQLRDVREMVNVHGDRLDRAYIERWVRELELEALWQRVQP